MKKFYTGILILLPILNIYGSFIPSIEIGTLLILILSSYFLFSGRIGGVGFDKLWIFVLSVFLFCTVLSTQFVVPNMDYTFRYFARYLKIVVIVLTITTIGKRYFDYNYAKKFLTKSSIVCSVFMFIQYAFFLIGIKISGILRFIPAAVQGDDTVEHVAEGMFRPSSFFIEPSHYAMFQMVFLCYLLSHPELEKRRKYLIITLVGILLSTSGTGYITTLIVFFASILIGGTIKKVYWKRLFGGVISVLIFLALIINTSIGQSSMNRFLNTDGTLGVAATGRLESGANELFFSLPDILQWLGRGFGYRTSDVYFSSLYAILYGDGFIGLIALIIMMLYYYFHTSNYGKYLCITYASLFIGTGVFNFGSIGLYFCLISTETIIYQSQKKLPQKMNTYFYR